MACLCLRRRHEPLLLGRAACLLQTEPREEAYVWPRKLRRRANRGALAPSRSRVPVCRSSSPPDSEPSSDAFGSESFALVAVRLAAYPKSDVDQNSKARCSRLVRGRACSEDEPASTVERTDSLAACVREEQAETIEPASSLERSMLAIESPAARTRSTPLVSPLAIVVNPSLPTLTPAAAISAAAAFARS